MAVNQTKGDKLKKNISIMTVLANCKTGDSRRLLDEYKIPQAINHEDLEYKLAKLYKEADDKVALEKKIAELHPHKDFILKYCAPKVAEPVPPIVEEAKPIATENETVVKAEKIIVEPTSNFSSCACGSCQKSNFEGSSQKEQVVSKTTDNEKLAMMGMFGLVAMITLVLITKK